MEKKVILKMIGVGAHEVPKIHQVVEASQSKNRFEWKSTLGYVKFTKLLGAKLNQQHGTYTMEIEITAVLEGWKSCENQKLYTPSSVLLNICDAANIFKEEEEILR